MKKLYMFLLMVFLVSGLPNLADGQQIDSLLSNNAVASLNMGIISENPGLQRSSIYFTGLYKIKSAVKHLQYVIKHCPEAEMRILAAKALKEIGDENSINFLKNQIPRESSEKAKNLYSAIVNEKEN